jgi:hypothetical protein
MKKLILPFSLVALALSALATNVSAERTDSRVDVSRLAAEDARTYRGDHDRHGHDGRAAAEIDQLYRDLRQVRYAIGDSRSVGQRIRDQYRMAKESTDRLNYQYKRGTIRGWEVRNRASEIRVRLNRIRAELRGRHIGVGGWR